MRKAVWKFELKPKVYQKIEMPINAEILTVQSQHEVAIIWALVDLNVKTEYRYFEIFGTGDIIDYERSDTDRNYIGTYQLYKGALIYHVFENKSKS